MAMPLSVPRYTTDMLRRFPRDGMRYELLDGVLLVTPQPTQAHQVIAGRLHQALAQYLHPAGLARIVSPGEIELRPRTLLDPDILVYPASYPLRARWTQIRGWWLAVEVLSRSSRVYDRDFKRDAYLALGVGEVWLVDPRDRVVLISRPDGTRDEPVREWLRWRPAGMPSPLELALGPVFEGLE